MPKLSKVEKIIILKEAVEYLGISYWPANQLVRKNKKDLENNKEKIIREENENGFRQYKI